VPGGNVTGAMILSAELDAKRLELLRELIAGRDADFGLGLCGEPKKHSAHQRHRSAGSPPWNAHCSEMVRTASDFDSAFVAGAVDGDQAMLVLTAPVIDENRSRLVVLAAGNPMPTMHEA